MRRDGVGDKQAGVAIGAPYGGPSPGAPDDGNSPGGSASRQAFQTPAYRRMVRRRCLQLIALDIDFASVTATRGGRLPLDRADSILARGSPGGRQVWLACEEAASTGRAAHQRLARVAVEAAAGEPHDKESRNDESAATEFPRRVPRR
jgi:hypothetical protein